MGTLSDMFKKAKSHVNKTYRYSPTELVRKNVRGTVGEYAGKLDTGGKLQKAVIEGDTGTLDRLKRRWGSAGSGAVGGAIAGAKTGGPWGAAVGAVGGGVYGYQDKRGLTGRRALQKFGAGLGIGAVAGTGVSAVSGAGGPGATAGGSVGSPTAGVDGVTTAGGTKAAGWKTALKYGIKSGMSGGQGGGQPDEYEMQQQERARRLRELRLRLMADKNQQMGGY